MRIGHFNRGLFEPGGMAAYVRQVSAFQTTLGHDVAFYDITMPANAASDGTGPGKDPDVRLYRVKDARDLFALARRHRLDILHLHCEIDYPDAPPLPTIRTIHNHQPYCPSGSRFLARSRQICDCRAGLTACLRGHLLEHCGSVRPVKMWEEFARAQQEQCFLRHIPAICISEYMKRQMVRAGYSEALLHVILHAASPVPAEATSPPPESPPRFVYLGRLTSLKGADTLLQALARMTIPAHLDIAGTGPLEAELRQQAQELGLENRVCFHGWLGRAQSQTLLQQCRALVFPSVWPEPAGLVTLEAAAMGRAVIGTRAGGLPEYALEGRNALLAMPGDISALRVLLDRLAADWQLAKEIGEQGRRLAQEHFTLKRHCAQLHQCYAECIQTWNIKGRHEEEQKHSA